MSKGKLIVLTGGNGCGKDTQALLLKKRLESTSQKVEIVHILRSHPNVTAFWRVISNPQTRLHAPLAEALGFYTMICETMQQVLPPLLAQGKVIILNRGPETPLVYNFYPQGLEKTYPELTSIYNYLIQELPPDLTLLIDVPVADLAKRAAQQAETDHLQEVEERVQEERRQSFLGLAHSQPNWRIIDGHPSVEEVAEALWQQVEPLID